MTDKSLHDGAIALLEEIKQRASAALVSTDGLSREESIDRARAVVEQARNRKLIR